MLKKERERERRKEVEEKSRKQGKSQFGSCARNVERKKKIGGKKKEGEKKTFFQCNDTRFTFSIALTLRSHGFSAKLQSPNH